MARAVARLDDTKVLPDPTLNEVIIRTLAPLSLPVMNSRLVRTTRNASLITLREWGLTTILRSSALSEIFTLSKMFFFL